MFPDRLAMWKKMGAPQRVKHYSFPAIVFFSCLFGAFLRLHMISDQILLDDEWHALFYATGHTLFYLLRYADAAATSAPMNAYAWILLHTSGWSEIALRLPSLIPGLLALVILPLLVRRVHGESTASIFSVFIALSPFLTFYSRIFRPYSALMFFGFTAVYSAGIWLHTGERRYHWLYLLSSSVALYFHPGAAIGIFAPWAVASALHARRRKIISGACPQPGFSPETRIIILTSGFTASLFLLTMQPTVIGENIGPGPSHNLETWRQFLLMLFGTSNTTLAVALSLICVAGLLTLLRNQFFWGAVFLLTGILHFLMLSVCDFMDTDVPVVLARYLTILFPLAHVCAAMGLRQCARIAGRVQLFRKPSARCFILCLVVAGFSSWVITNPLWYAYARQNSFTNHSAFIESGQFSGWERPYSSGFAHWSVSSGSPRMSLFYNRLPPHTESLIEYPMMLCDHFNYYYFYQYRHGRKILIGYTDMVHAMPKDRDGVDADFFVNHVVRAVDDRRGIRFRNMVDILDGEAVRRSRADYLICHKDLFKEFLPGVVPPENTHVPGIEECIERSMENFGPPVFEDETIIVFNVGHSSTASPAIHRVN